MAGNRPYALPSSVAPNRYSWADAELEPKQQHRFVAYMPVFMPRGIVTDAKELAMLVKIPSGGGAPQVVVDAVTAAKARAEDSEKIEGVDDAFMNAANADTAAGAISQMVDSCVIAYAKPAIKLEEIEKILITDQLAFKRTFEGTFGASSRSVLHTRVSPYIVKSFKPPSFGINVVESKIPSAAMSTLHGSKTTANLGRAQLTFVSTLQDDLHFSLLFLWYMGITATGNDSVKSFPLFNPRACDDQIISEGQRRLVIEEISGDRNPAQAKSSMLGTPADMEGIIPLRTDANPDPSTGKSRTMFTPTIVGLHKIEDPLISSVQFSPFAYNGTDFVEITMELTYSDTQDNFYSYETYINTAANGGDTRYQNSRGDGYSARPGEQEVSNKANEAFRRGFGMYPRMAVGDKNLMGLDPEKPLHKIMADIKTDTTVKYEMRRHIIKNAMEGGNPRHINQLVSNNMNAAEDSRQADIKEQERLAEIEDTRRGEQMTREETRAGRRENDLRGAEHRAERQRLGASGVRERRQANRASRRQTAATDRAARSLPDSAYDTSDL